MSNIEKNNVNVVKSPCMSLCSLNENDICIGCYRSGQEITDWGAMDNEQKKTVLKKVAQREKDSGNFIAL